MADIGSVGSFNSGQSVSSPTRERREANERNLETVRNREELTNVREEQNEQLASNSRFESPATSQPVERFPAVTDPAQVERIQQRFQQEVSSNTTTSPVSSNNQSSLTNQRAVESYNQTESSQRRDEVSTLLGVDLFA